MDIVLFGIQGSGKGTIGKASAQKYGYSYFETGAELRRLSSEDSELGKKVKEIIEAGHLVPNEVVMEIIEDFINNLEEGKDVIFDGIPRKQEQADTFNALMTSRNRTFKGILVAVSEEVALKRLTTRRICKNCKTVYPADYNQANCEKCEGELITRSDDTPDSIKTRIEAYNNETIPVIEKYRAEDKIIEMNGEVSIPEAQAKFSKIIENL